MPKVMFFKKLVCFVFGHKYRLKRKIVPGIREIKCVRCKAEFGMSDDQHCLYPLDFEIMELHEDLLKPVNIKQV